MVPLVAALALTVTPIRVERDLHYGPGGAADPGRVSLPWRAARRRSRPRRRVSFGPKESLDATALRSRGTAGPPSRSPAGSSRPRRGTRRSRTRSLPSAGSWPGAGAPAPVSARAAPRETERLEKQLVDGLLWAEGTART